MVSYLIFRFLSLLRFVSLLSETQNECPSYLVPRKLGACNLKCRMEREVCGKMICYSFWNLISVVPSIVRLYVLVGRSIFFSVTTALHLDLGPESLNLFPVHSGFQAIPSSSFSLTSPLSSTCSLYAGPRWLSGGDGKCGGGDSNGSPFAYTLFFCFDGCHFDIASLCNRAVSCHCSSLYSQQPDLNYPPPLLYINSYHRPRLRDSLLPRPRRRAKSLLR